MFLKKISLINFKNLGDTSLEFSEGINCFVGSNGAGKTNLLDAVYYLSMCKSAFNMTDGQSVAHGKDFFVIDGTYEIRSEEKENIIVSFKKGSGKVVKKSGKEYDKIADHIGRVPLVCVSPADSFLISDSADERRRWLNSFISQTDKSYLSALIRYNRVLNERNRLLKDYNFNPTAAEIIGIHDMQLADTGNVIYTKRKEIIEKMTPVTSGYYEALSGGKEKIDLQYRSDVGNDNLRDILTDSLDKDMMMGHTTKGIHRDEVKMTIEGHNLRKYGSQGQQKSFLLALKLAQYQLLAQETGCKPILLFDDLFDKLDMDRVESLLNLVGNEGFGQIFVTDCNKTRLEGILGRLSGNHRLFSVLDGKINAS